MYTGHDTRWNCHDVTHRGVKSCGQLLLHRELGEGGGGSVAKGTLPVHRRWNGTSLYTSTHLTRHPPVPKPSPYRSSHYHPRIDRPRQWGCSMVPITKLVAPGSLNIGHSSFLNVPFSPVPCCVLPSGILFPGHSVERSWSVSKSSLC